MVGVSPYTSLANTLAKPYTTLANILAQLSQSIGSGQPIYWLWLWGLWFAVWGLGFVVWGLGFGVWSLGFGVWDLGVLFLFLFFWSRVSGCGFEV